MWKIIAATVAALLLFSGGLAQAAELPLSTSAGSSADHTASAPGTAGALARGATAGRADVPGSPHAASPTETGETKAIVVGLLGFVLMVGTGAAVLWYTARRRPVE